MNDTKLDIAAAKCVEDLLEALGTEGGKAWFTIVRRHMKQLTTPGKQPRVTSERARQIIESIRQS